MPQFVLPINITMVKKNQLPSVFRVTISSPYCKNLRPCDSNGLSDPYVLANFDHFRSFKLKRQRKTLNPSWDNFSLSFTYETRFQRKLHLKRFHFIVKDQDKYSRDDLIGKCSVDLASLAMGPSKVMMLVKHHEAPSGELHINVQMEQVSDAVTVHLRQCRIVNFEPKNSTSDLSIGLNTVSGKSGKTKTRYSTPLKIGRNETQTSDQWEVMPEVVLEGVTFNDLLHDALVVKLSKKGLLGRYTIARGTIPFTGTGVLTGKNRQPIPFKCALSNSGGKHIGDFEGIIDFMGLPRYAQFANGENLDGDIYGTPLLPRLSKPKRYKGTGSYAANNDTAIVKAQPLSPPTSSQEGYISHPTPQAHIQAHGFIPQTKQGAQQQPVSFQSNQPPLPSFTPPNAHGYIPPPPTMQPPQPVHDDSNIALGFNARFTQQPPQSLQNSHFPYSGPTQPSYQPHQHQQQAFNHSNYNSSQQGNSCVAQGYTTPQNMLYNQTQHQHPQQWNQNNVPQQPSWQPPVTQTPPLQVQPPNSPSNFAPPLNPSYERFRQ